MVIQPVFLWYSKKENRAEASGSNNSKDIHLENFDIAYGEKVLIRSATISLGKLHQADRLMVIFLPSEIGVTPIIEGKNVKIIHKFVVPVERITSRCVISCS